MKCKQRTEYRCKYEGKKKYGNFFRIQCLANAIANARHSSTAPCNDLPGFYDLEGNELNPPMNGRNRSGPRKALY